MPLSGSVSRLAQNIRKVIGALSFSGAVSRLVNKARTYSGSISFSGAYSYATKAFHTYTAQGALTLAGAISRLAQKLRIYTGALSLSGNYFRTKIVNRAKQGVLNLAGAISRAIQAQRTYQGSLSFIGTLSYFFAEVTKTGALTFVGAISRALQSKRTYQGALTFVGIVSIGGVYTGSDAGQLTFQGQVTSQVSRQVTIQGELNLSGDRPLISLEELRYGIKDLIDESNFEIVGAVATHESNFNHSLIDEKVFYAYDAAGDIDISSGETDITLDTEIKDDASFSHSADSAEVTINTTGEYMICLNVGCYIGANINRCVAEFKLKVDTGGGYADIGGTIVRCPMDRYPTSGYGSSTGSKSIIASLTANDKIKIVGQRIGGSGTVNTLANACGLLIRNIA